jgi:hypothetical protein
VETTQTDVAERLFAGGLAAIEMFTVHLGVRLGLYRALHSLGTATPGDLADAAHIHPRYAREWLEQQAVMGIVEVASVDPTDPYASAFRLPDAHVPALLEEDSPLYTAPMARFVAGIAGALPDLIEAFRTGAGVPYAAYGADTRAAISGLNRPMYRGDLAKVWLAALPDVHAKLTAGPARLLDLGCGEGWSSVALAEAFPAARIDGFDLDDASIGQAADAFTAPGDEVERLNYAFSVTHCLPATRAEGAAEEAGTVLRQGTVRRYAERAGFGRFEVLPIEHDLWRFYRLGA